MAPGVFSPEIVASVVLLVIAALAAVLKSIVTDKKSAPSLPSDHTDPRDIDYIRGEIRQLHQLIESAQRNLSVEVSRVQRELTKQLEDDCVHPLAELHGRAREDATRAESVATRQTELLHSINNSLTRIEAFLAHRSSLS